MTDKQKRINDLFLWLIDYLFIVFYYYYKPSDDMSDTVSGTFPSSLL